MTETKDKPVKSCPVCDEKFPEGTDICPEHGAKLVVAGPDPMIGTTLADRYEVLAELGRGGTAIVYRGRHRMMNKPIAIKMLRQVLLNDSISIRRFQQEAQVVSKLSHTHIVAAHDFGLTADQRPYLVMDLVEGVTLSQLIERDGYVPAPFAVHVFMQVCEGLIHAHDLGLVHRDLKPENIILLKSTNSTQNDLVKILDFGIAKFLPQAGVAEQKLTETGCVFGTSLYMSPEHCMGKNLDARSDIYSLGCVMYETLTGKAPFVGDNVLDTMQKHISDKAEPLHKLRPEVPERLQHIVAKAMAKEPAGRYQTVGDLLADLMELNLPGMPVAVTSRSARVAKRSAFPKWAPIAAVAVAALAVGAWFYPKPAADCADQVTGASQAAAEKRGSGDAATVIPAAATSSSKGSGNASDAEVAPITDDPEVQSKLKDSESRTAERLASLALTCHQNGKCDIAEKLFQKAIVVSKRVYGPNSPQTIERINDLATFYLGIGMTDRAEPLLKQLMEMKEPAKPKRGA